MKGEESSAGSPMFPRLHVNDTDKGGPRAPPRNKMALYEQLSIAKTQRFNSNNNSSSSSLPIPSQTNNNRSCSSNQGNGAERTPFSPFHVSPSAPAYSAEKANSRSSERENMRTPRAEFEKRFTRHVSSNSATAARSVAECSSLRQHESSSARNLSRKRVDDDDDFRVPTFVNSESASYLKKDTTGMETKRLTPFHANSRFATFNSSTQFPNSCEKPFEETSTSDMELEKHERNCNEQKMRDTAIANKHKEKSTSHSEGGEKLAEPLKLSKSSSDREHLNTINVIDKTRLGNSGMCRDSGDDDDLDGPECLNDRDVQNENYLMPRSETHSKASFGNIQRNQNMTDNCNRKTDDKIHDSLLRQGDADRNDEVSDSSMVDSASGLEISPDDVVGIIGPKHFWKARRAIVNQQRVFALQVFELHRLIKVQKLIAASPQILLGENLYTTSQKVPIKDVSVKSNVKPQPLLAEQKDDSQTQSLNTECRTENPGAPSEPPQDTSLNKGLGQLPRYSPYSGTPPAVPPAPDIRPNPWCFQPPTNQWLVPVMSPSEGLIYKPYTGPCPPAAGFMAPVYQNYSPMSLPPGFGIASSHQQQNMGVLSAAPVAPNYFPAPYGLQTMNPNISSSAVEQVTPMTGPRPNGQTEQNSRSSCNMSFPRNEGFASQPWRFHASKDSELQGSTASSPAERAQGGRDALPLFPMASTVECSAQPSESNGKEQQSRVIKVMPHNARSATESAARIFKSIQEERQHMDS